MLDPRDGSVLALATNPTYNPADFVGGISPAKFNAYLNDPNHPARRPDHPGPVRARVDLQAGDRHRRAAGRDHHPDDALRRQGLPPGRPDQVLQRQPPVLRPVNLPRAITVSSDAYFYNIGAQFWNGRASFGDDGLQNVARRARASAATTGIPLPNEASGRIPDPASRKKLHDEPTRRRSPTAAGSPATT